MAQIDPGLMASLAGKRLGIQQQHDQGLSLLGQKYNTDIANINSYATDAARQINDKYAAQGMSGHTVRLDDQGRMQKSVGERKNILSQQNAWDKYNINNSYQNALQGLTDQQNQWQIEANRAEADQRLRQSQIDADNMRTAALARQQQISAAPAPAPVSQGPSQSDLVAWYTEVARQQEAQRIWNEAVWNNAIAAQKNRTEYPMYDRSNAGGRRLF